MYQPSLVPSHSFFISTLVRENKDGLVVLAGVHTDPTQEFVSIMSLLVFV